MSDRGISVCGCGSRRSFSNRAVLRGDRQIGFDPLRQPFYDRNGDSIANGVIPEGIQIIGPKEFALFGWYRPVIGEALQSLALDWNEAAYPAIRIAGVVAAPVGAGVPGRAGIETMGQLLDYWPFERISNAFLKGGKRTLPIRSALLVIPRAAFGLKKYFCGTSPVSMASNNEDSLA